MLVLLNGRMSKSNLSRKKSRNKGDRRTSRKGRTQLRYAFTANIPYACRREQACLKHHIGIIIKGNCSLVQVSLDEAAFLLDLASIDGSWSDYLERIVECYKEAGLDDIAKFVSYTD